MPLDYAYHETLGKKTAAPTAEALFAAEQVAHKITKLLQDSLYVLVDCYMIYSTY